MDLFSATADSLLRTATNAVMNPDAAGPGALDALRTPIYVTDADGVIIQFNKACVAFAGRTPELGQDRWCVTWKLFTEAGEPLAHDQCPMAVTLRTRQPVRGAIAVAERPDGERVTFMPFPTPLVNENGDFVGALNMLVDITDERRAVDFRARVEQCRRLMAAAGDLATITSLKQMAAEYELQWRALDKPDAAAGPDRPHLN